MHSDPHSTLRAALLGLALCLAPQGARAGEAVETAPVEATLRSDPCGFFRSQSYGRGLTHYATEMLWACEAIASRRAAAMSLSERMEAVDLALERYRAAVVEAGAATFAQDRLRARDTGYLGASDSAKAALAERTGMLAALEAIRAGF